MLKKLYIILSAYMLLNVSGCSTPGEQNSVSRDANLVFTCTPTQLFRCEPEENACMTIPLMSTRGEIQIIIDLGTADARSVAGNKIISEAQIDSVQFVNQLLYLTGKGIGIDNSYRTWNAVINRQDGKLYSSSITTGAGHVIYGECHEQK